MLKRFVVALAAALCIAAPASAQQQTSTVPSAPAVQLSSVQRDEIAGAIISRWMGDVMKSPGGDVKAWSDKLRNVVTTADQANVLRASQMPSLDLIHAALVGAAIDDAAVKAALSGAASAGAPQVLGSPVADTTYTPLPNGRCRVASSLAINSPLPAGVTRGLSIEFVSSYASQGGVGSVLGGGSSNCGIPSMTTAFAISVSARSPVADGVLKIFASNRPNAAGNTIPFYVSAKGGGTDLIVESCQSCGDEISILSTAQTHYIIDVIGYFMPPEATALQCVDQVASTGIATPGQFFHSEAPGCPTGYMHTATECRSGSYELFFSYSSNGVCNGKNLSPSNAEYAAKRVCCRVPGR